MALGVQKALERKAGQLTMELDVARQHHTTPVYRLRMMRRLSEA
jgi:hypothetical protein